MGRLAEFWKKTSHSEALDRVSGPMEITFFESIYRMTYVIGLSTAEQKTGYMIYKNILQATVILLMCAEVGYVLTDAADIDDAAKGLGVFVLQCITQYRYRNVVSNMNIYNNLAKSMDSSYCDISTETRRQIVDTWARRSEIYLKLLLTLAYFSLGSWCVDSLFYGVEYSLVTDIYLPYNYKTPTRYLITYIIVMVALWFSGNFVLLTGVTIQSHLIHILCQFELLADCFENLLEDSIRGYESISKNELATNREFAEKYTKRLDSLVEEHITILSNTKKLETALSRPMLAQLGASGLMICFVGYEAVMTYDQGIVTLLSSLFFLAYNVFELYIICKWCETITDWSSNIGKAIYSSGWEYGVTNIPGVRSTFLIILTRTNQPLYLTAGGLYNLSIDSFARLMKGSYSALTFLLGSRPNE